MRNKLLIAVALVALVAPRALAQDNVNARIDALEAQIADLKHQLDDLKAASAAKPEPAAEPAGEPSSASPSVTVGGMMETQFTGAVGGSLKQAIFSGPKGNSDILLTHIHPNLRATLDDKTSAYITWCLSHVGSTAIYESYLEHNINDNLDAKIGRFILPFGAWNPISNPTTFKSVSQPLMYLGHEDAGIVLNGGPRPILNDEHSDIGLLLSGRTEGKRAVVAWDGYVVNGFGDMWGDYPDAWVDYRSSEDTNSSKSLGARLATTMGGLTLGASWTGGKWDPLNKYKYNIAAADATWRSTSGLTLRAEYATNPIDRAAADGGKIHRKGWYAMAEQPLGPKWTGVLMYSTLSERPTANVNHMSRLTVGADYQLAPNTTIKTEIGRLFIGDFIGNPVNAPDGTAFNDVTTLKVSSVVSF